jgi:hypothetical protein
MGFSVSWLAVREDAISNVLSQLGLAETEEREWIPESQIVLAHMPTGWCVVYFNDANASALNPESLQALSALSEVIACRIEEHVMCSTAAKWQNGGERWFVAHDAEDGLENLDVLGDPPSELDAIRDARSLLQRQSSGVDYFFDLPLELAHREVGFRHDAAFDEAESEPFVVLTALG